MDNRMWKLLQRKQWMMFSQPDSDVGPPVMFLESHDYLNNADKSRASGHEEEINHNICIATLAMKCLHKSCMDNRMQKLLWRNWWAMFSQQNWWWGILAGLAQSIECMQKLSWKNWCTMLTQQDLQWTVFKSLASTTEWRNCCEETDDCLLSKTYSEVSSRVLHEQNEGTIVKKLMNDAYTARPTMKCLQGSCKDNSMASRSFFLSSSTTVNTQKSHTIQHWHIVLVSIYHPLKTHYIVLTLCTKIICLQEKNAICTQHWHIILVSLHHALKKKTTQCWHSVLKSPHCLRKKHHTVLTLFTKIISLSPGKRYTCTG